MIIDIKGTLYSYHKPRLATILYLKTKRKYKKTKVKEIETNEWLSYHKSNNGIENYSNFTIIGGHRV